MSDFLYGANVGFRRRVFQSLGLFRTDLGPRGNALRRGDDTEMIDRVVKAGRRVIYAPSAVVEHKVTEQRMRMAYFRRWRYSSGMSTAALRRTRRVPAWLIQECVSNGVTALAAYGVGQRRAAIRRELGFWSQLGQIVGALRRP